MTSVELFNKIKPSEQYIYLAQATDKGLDLNSSDIFSRLIKDAARCNHYNSDIYYDLCFIDNRFKEFNPIEGFEPIWIGFRKMGVDCTSFVLCRCDDESTYGSLSNNYFALYSISVDKENCRNDFYSVKLNEYAV